MSTHGRWMADCTLCQTHFHGRAGQYGVPRPSACPTCSGPLVMGRGNRGWHRIVEVLDIAQRRERVT